MPVLAKELNGQVPPTLLSQAQRPLGNRGPRTEHEDAGAGDQWPVPEMWVSACVGRGFRETPTRQSAQLPLIFCPLTMYINAV
jgi:hypothetical protein